MFEPRLLRAMSGYILFGDRRMQDNDGEPPPGSGSMEGWREIRHEVTELVVHDTGGGYEYQVVHDWEIGSSLRQLYEEVLGRAGLSYGDAYLEKDGQRLHPDSDMNPMWETLHLVHDPMRPMLWPVAREGPPTAASSQGPDAGAGAGAGASRPQEDHWRCPKGLLALNSVQWPESCEWPCILHVGRNVPTEALNKPPWELFKEQFPRWRFFVSISFGHDVVVVGGFLGMKAKHVMALMESLYMQQFSVRWVRFSPEMDEDDEIDENTWLMAKIEGERLV